MNLKHLFVIASFMAIGYMIAELMKIDIDKIDRIRIQYQEENFYR